MDIDITKQPDPGLLPDIHIKFQALPPLETVPIIVVDIETHGLYPETGRIYDIGMKTRKTVLILQDEDEKAMLEDFCRRIRTQHGNTLLIGHNLMKFDLPFIIARCKKYDIPCPFSIRTINGKPLNRIINKAKPWTAYDEIESQCVQIIDTQMLAELEDARSLFKSVGLKSLALELGTRSEARLELSPDEIDACWATGDTERIKRYLTFDLEDTMAIFDKLYPPYYEQLSFIPRIDPQEIVLASPAAKVERLLIAYYKKKATPSPTMKYEGAYTSCMPGLYENVQKMDVASLYPGIMIQYQVTTDKDPDLVLPALLKDILKLRLEYKKQPEMKARSNALKLLMNSAYGLFGSPRGYNCPEAAARVTAIGRAILHSMIDKLTELGATIIECDTDGIYYSSENEVHDKVQAVLPTGIRIEPENKWTWGVFYKSKNYFIMKKDGMWDCKGVFRKRDTPKFKIEFMQQYADLYRGDPAAAEAYYQSLLHQILSGEYPVDNLSVKKKIGKAEKARLKFGKPGESKTTYQGYGEPMKRGGFKKTCVMEGPYNKEFYSKMLTEFYTELKGIFGGSHESS